MNILTKTWQYIQVAILIALLALVVIGGWTVTGWIGIRRPAAITGPGTTPQQDTPQHVTLPHTDSATVTHSGVTHTGHSHEMYPDGQLLEITSLTADNEVLRAKVEKLKQQVQDGRISKDSVVQQLEALKNSLQHPAIAVQHDDQPTTWGFLCRFGLGASYGPVFKPWSHLEGYRVQPLVRAKVLWYKRWTGSVVAGTRGIGLAPGYHLDKFLGLKNTEAILPAGPTWDLRGGWVGLGLAVDP